MTTRLGRGNEQRMLEGRPSEGLREHRCSQKRQVDHAAGRNKARMVVNI
jgi:hypothetical protein